MRFAVAVCLWTAFVLGSLICRAEPQARVVIPPAAADGISPGIAQLVTDEARRAAAMQGYTVVDPESTAQAMRQAGVAAPRTAEELWRVSHAAGAAHALGATVSQGRGHYIVRLELANRDGTGPFSANGSAPPDGLVPLVRSLVARLLSPAGAPLRPASPDAEPPEQERPYDRLRLAAQTEAAFGVHDGFFYNHLVGARLDFRFAPNLSFGPYLGYVNLKGRTGREHNVLAYGQLDYRLGLNADDSIQIPFRFGTGYFPKNGPFLRLAAGLAFTIGSSTDLVFDLVAPTFWVARDKTLVSLDVAFEAGFSF